MRLLRTLGVVVGAVALALAGLPGLAVAAPTAPYDAFTVNGRWSHSFDPSNASFGFFMSGPEGFGLGVNQPGADPHFFDAAVYAPIGQHLSVGTFATLGVQDATHYGLSVSGDGADCDSTAGSITIRAMTRDPSTGAITSLAASYHQQGCLESYGELRWNSTVGYVDAVQDPSSVDFGNVPVDQTSAPTTVTFTSAGSDRLTFGAAKIIGTSAGSYGITANTCTNVTLANGQSCTVTLVAHPVSAEYQDDALSIADNSALGYRQVRLGGAGTKTPRGQFTAVQPYRMLDTRSGLGAPAARPLGTGGTLDLQLVGRGPVPFQGVVAVVLNVTVTGPTTGGFLAVYPTGTPRPNASSINFPAHWTGANSVTVPVSADGRVTLFNLSGNTHVIVDISGYYASDNLPINYWGGEYHPHYPTRVLDTRDPADGGALPAGWQITVPIDYDTDINPHVRAFALNITAVSPQSSGFLTAWNGTGGPPNASTLNFTRNATVPNFAIVPTAPCSTVITGCSDAPSVTILNTGGGSVHVVVDVVGFYDDSQLIGGLRFTPINPTRITDTREGLGAPHRLGQDSITTVTAPSSVVGPDTVALSMNVTGISPDGYTYLSLWPAGGQRPTASTLNLTPHEIHSNAGAIGLDSSKRFSIYNQAGTVDLVIDVAGRFDASPGSSTPLAAKARTAGPQVVRQLTPEGGTPHRQAA